MNAIMVGRLFQNCRYKIAVGTSQNCDYINSMVNKNNSISHRIDLICITFNLISHKINLICNLFDPITHSGENLLDLYHVQFDLSENHLNWSKNPLDCLSKKSARSVLGRVWRS